MNDIRISPAVQVVGLLGLIAALAWTLKEQLPEIQRYLKIRSM